MSRGRALYRVPFVGFLARSAALEAERHAATWRTIAGSVSEARRAFQPSREREGEGVKPAGVSRAQFRRRYRRLQVMLVLALFMLGFSVAASLDGATAMQHLGGGFGAALMALLYHGWAFQAWRARDLWRRWENPPQGHTMQQFHRALGRNPMEWFPISLPHTSGRGRKSNRYNHRQGEEASGTETYP